jgi:tetratricopeptide (TPR) repeat protein
MDFEKIVATAIGEGRKVPPSPKEQAEARQLCQRARGLGEEGRFIDAIEMFVESLRREPLDTVAIGGLACSLASLGEGDHALGLLDKAARYEGRNVDLAVARGRCLKEMGRFDEAAAAFDSAQSIDPSNAVIAYEQGLCQVARGRDALALPFFDTALQRDQKYASAWDQKGDCLRRLNRLDDALVCLDKAVTLAPELASAWHNKAQVLDALSRGPEAGQCYAKFVALAPAHMAEKQFMARQRALELGVELA